jgi:hypothetical protein
MGLAQQNQEVKAQNQALAGQYASQRSAIANQNIENLSQAEN